MKNDFIRTPDANQRIVDGNLKLSKSLFLPDYSGITLSINDNPNEAGAIAYKDGSVWCYNGTDWFQVGVTNTYNNGGVVNNSGNIEIGGTIIGGRSLNLNSYAFEMFDNTTGNESDYTQYQGSIVLTGGKVNTFNYGKVQVGRLTANLGYSVNVSGVQKINQVELNGMFIQDNINLKGFVYGGNYSANFTARSLIDKGYADATYATISGSGFVTSVTVATANGVSASSSGGATPVLTFSLGAITPTSVNGVSSSTMAFVDPTSSIQTQLNSKLNLSGGTLSGDIQQSAGPVNANSLINKSYVDNLITGITWKQEVRAGSTVNLTLSGTQTVDGVSLVANDRILVKNQTAQTDNGIYLVASGSWTRSLDADSSSEIGSATVLIRNGTVNKNTQWTCTNSTDPVIGTDNITFGAISGAGTYTNGTGIALASNVFSLDLTYTDARYLNQNTTGSAAKWTTSRNLAGNAVDGSANVAFSNKFIVQGTTDSGLSGAQFMGSLATGLIKNTTSTGVFSIAIAGTDYLVSNQSITLSGDISGSGTTAITTTIGSLKVVNSMIANSTIDLTAKVTGLLPDGNISSASTWNAKFSLPTLTNHSVLFSDGTTIAQDNSNFYYNSTGALLSIGVAGDFSGTNMVNIYGQYDSYQPQSAIGLFNSATVTPGFTVSTSRGTGASPVINNTGDLIGGFSGWAYTGSSPAYTYMGGMVVTAVGATSTNLGGQLDFYTKADGASTTISRQTIANDGTITFSKYGTGLLHSNSSGVVSSSLISISDMSATGSATSSNFLRGDNTLTNVLQQNNIAITNTDGLYLQNNNASTLTVTRQISPSLHFGAHVWNATATAADNYADWIIYADVTSAATPTTTLTFASSRGTSSTPSYTARMAVLNDGSMVLGGGSGTLTAGSVIASFIQGNSAIFTTASMGTANFYANGGSSFLASVTNPTFASVATNNVRVSFNGSTNASVSSGNTYANVMVGSTPFQVGTGATIPWAANMVVKAPGTITLVGTGAVTNSASLYIESASTTATNNYSLYIGSGNIGLNTAPTTSASTYDLLTRNTSTGVVEKVASSNLSWIVSSNDLLAQTGAVANVTTPYTVGSSTGTFRIGGYVNITAVTLDVIQFQCAFTDENNASQTIIFYPMGATAAGLSTTGFNALSDATIRCKNGTTITIKTVLTTGTGSITYDVGCQIQQLR